MMLSSKEKRFIKIIFLSFLILHFDTETDIEEKKFSLHHPVAHLF